MLTLKADNQAVVNGAKYAFLLDNYPAGTTVFAFGNTVGFAANNFVALGEIGNETTEIMQIQSIDPVTNLVTMVAGSIFPHQVDTKAQLMQFNQVRFYYAFTDLWNNTTPLTGYMNIQVDDYYTRYYDAAHQTGFGYFVFHNSFTLDDSMPSNPIPYTDFEQNSVKKIFDNFFSQLNSKEFSLITPEDSFNWLNEAYAQTQNQLNMVNQEFNVPAQYPITFSSGSNEVQLPSDFGTLIAVNDALSGNEIPHVSLRRWNGSNAPQANIILPQSPFYYLRNKFLGITPVPASPATWNIVYTSITPTLVSLYDTVNVPNNNFYLVRDYMLYLASRKLNRTPAQAEADKKSWEDGIKLMLLSAHKQNNERETFGILRSANQ